MLNNFTETELSHEQWRDIDGYEGMYQVSDLGREQTKKYGYWRVMKPIKSSNGYLHLDLSKDGKNKTFSVHRLVAQAFIPNDDETKTQINHRNECKSENKVSNLEWCSASYNQTYNGLQQRRMSNYHRSNYKRNAIKDLYDHNLTYAENLEIFKSNGIECSNCTVARLRKDLGLIK